MSISPFTRPPAGEPKDYEKLNKDYDDRVKQSVVNNHDPRLTSFIGWGGFFVSGILLWNLQSAHADSKALGDKVDTLSGEVAVLTSRPIGVSVDEFRRQLDLINGRFDKDEAVMAGHRR